MSTITNGVYFISAHQQGTYLQFTDGSGGSNLSTLHFTGNTEQQWQITHGDGSPDYTFQNVRYNNFASWSGPSTTGGLQFVFESQVAQSWFVQNVQNGIVVSPDPGFTNAWNVDGGFSSDGTVVIVYPLDSVRTNSIWSLQPVSSSSTTTSQSSSSLLTSTASSSATTSGAAAHGGLTLDNKIGLGAGISGGVLTIFGLWLTWYIYKQSKKSKEESLEKGGI